MNLLKKFPYLKKDILWVIGIIVIFLLVGSPFLSRPEINNIIFVIFSILAWKKRNKLSNTIINALSIGRIFSLLTFTVIFFYFVFPIFTAVQTSNISMIPILLFDKIHLFMLSILFLYLLQYYIFSAWKTEFGFRQYKNLILIELSGLAIMFLISWSGILY